MKFNGTSAKLNINGTLRAYGTSANKIYFTSYKDDTVGGDSNGDGASSGSAGDWDTVQVNAGASSEIFHVIIRYGGYAGGSSQANVYNNGGVLDIINSEIATSSVYGVYQTSGTSTIVGSKIYNQTHGAYITGGKANISSSALYNNTNYGFFNGTGSSLHAEYNYWGDASGPYHPASNPSGTGNDVSNDVTYDPWLDQMHYLNVYLGEIVSAVDGSEIRWDGSTTFTAAWYTGMDTWNAEGAITIATDTIFTVEDLTVSDVDFDNVLWAGRYIPDLGVGAADDIELNEHYLRDYTNNQKQNVVTHELGHALGLGHSYSGNVMYEFVASLISLGTQDVSDYDFLWW